MATWSDGMLPSRFEGHSFVRPPGGAILSSRPARMVRPPRAAGGQGQGRPRFLGPPEGLVLDGRERGGAWTCPGLVDG